MKFRLIRTAFLITAGLTVLSLTACGGGSGTISSLTDSDSTTSSVATGAAAAAASDTSSVPAVTPSVVSGQSAAPGAAAQPTAAPATNKAATGAAAAAGTAAVDSAAATVEEAEEKVPDNVQASPEEEDFEPAGEGNTGKTTTDVNFRTEPNTDGGEDTIIDELSEGTEVTILGKEGDFYKVQIDDVVGYIHSDYIE